MIAKIGSISEPLKLIMAGSMPTNTDQAFVNCIGIKSAVNESTGVWLMTITDDQPDIVSGSFVALANIEAENASALAYIRPSLGSARSIRFTTRGNDGLVADLSFTFAVWRLPILV